MSPACCEGWCGTRRKNDIYPEANELGRDLGQSCASPLRPTILYRDGMTLDPAKFVQARLTIARSETASPTASTAAAASGSCVVLSTPTAPANVRSRRQSGRTRGLFSNPVPGPSKLFLC